MMYMIWYSICSFTHGICSLVPKHLYIICSFSFIVIFNILTVLHVFFPHDNHHMEMGNFLPLGRYPIFGYLPTTRKLPGYGVSSYH